METAMSIWMLQTELTAMRAMRARLNDKIAKLEKAIDLLEETETEYATENTVIAEITNAVGRILDEDRPLHRSTIMELLEDQGIVIGGKDKLQNLSAYLSEDHRFIPGPNRGYWTLANSPIPEERAQYGTGTGPAYGEPMDVDDLPF